MQRRIGLTGGIASGKSSVGRLLEARGWPVLDADRFARDALAPGQPATKDVLQRYGAAVGNSTGLNRAALGRIVFHNASERRWLEALIHPVVRNQMQLNLKALEHEPVVVLMIPLLFESGLTGLCSEIWVVSCSEEQQIARMRERDGLNEADARARLAAQWPLPRKQALADLVINNSGSLEQLEQELDCGNNRQQ